MHEMEKAALDDPFLAEAMEGYEGWTEKDWKNQLAAAHRALAETGTEAKVIPMHTSTGRWWKTAAAILVIGSGAALTYVLTKNKTEEKNNPQIAKVEQNISQAPIARDNTNLAPVKKTVTPPPPVIREYRKEPAANTNITQTGPEVIPGKDFVYKPTTLPQVDSIKFANNRLAGAGKISDVVSSPAVIPTTQANTNNSVAAENMASNRELAKQNDFDAEVFKRKSANAANKNERQVNNFFNAQVVAADNSPLPFSNITVKDANLGTYADVKGNFRLFSTDTILTVEIKSVGYQPRTLYLRSGQPMNKIILLEDENNVMDKVTAQNKQAMPAGKLRRASVLSDTSINVEPKDGWDNYNTYVANNLEIPDDIPQNEFHGEVELTFDVKANGTISNIRVNKSMGTAYDEAAKRVLLQGPQWKVKKGKKTSASVKVKF